MRTIVLCVYVMLLAGSVTAGESKYFYVYKEKDGTTWYTDKKMPKEQYQLIAKIGRPTYGSVNCANSKSAEYSRRVRSHAPAIATYAKLYDLDPKLITAIIRVESCFDHRAVSSVGAKGLMQLMPETARSMGVHNVFDADQNIRGGARYFRAMLERFDNNLELALAAYNAGPAAVERYQGVPPYKETQGYVKKVLYHFRRYGGSSS